MPDTRDPRGNPGAAGGNTGFPPPPTGGGTGPYGGQQAGQYDGQQAGQYGGHPGGPYGGQPGGPYAGPYAGHQAGPYGTPPPFQPQPLPRMDPLAIVALVMSFLVGLTPIALVLGIVALVRISRSGQRGKGQAVAAVAISSAVVLLATVGLTVAALSEPERGEDGRVDEATSASVFDIRKGDCFNGRAAGRIDDADGRQSELRVGIVPCDEPHDGEAYATFDIEGHSSFPGMEEVQKIADDRCMKLVSGYMMDTWSYADDVDVAYYHPESTSWARGDREVLCFLSSSGDRLEGSLRQDGTTLTDEQTAYLEAVKPLYDVQLATPEAEPEDDLTANTEWAARAAKAQADAVRDLKAADWSPETGKQVTELVTELEKGLPGWQGAGRATTADDFYLSYGTAYDHSGQKQAQKVREALDLATDMEDAPAL
ncbi:septum formation family protein [Streptomyces thermolineatus]|uniref:DUF4190 domain-containing protein n=1 Tax=Streptomyces thermolineatus TaxID=44033 RepID=UPI003851326C